MDINSDLSLRKPFLIPATKTVSLNWSFMYLLSIGTF